MEEITAEINKINSKIDEIEFLLKKPFKDWTEEEKEEYGNKEHLRKKEDRLRKKEEQLREELIEERRHARKKEEQLTEQENLKQRNLLFEKSKNQGIATAETDLMDIELPPFDP
ncbi:hypothetical protein HDV04_001032 [Boothiomyces sp. JEL0838]|nr:hypothetical protein HDV04_001032 [Boothiomyces sp. JEL0838]